MNNNEMPLIFSFVCHCNNLKNWYVRLREYFGIFQRLPLLGREIGEVVYS